MARFYSTRFYICALCITSTITIYLFITSTNLPNNSSQIDEAPKSNFAILKAVETKPVKKIIRIASMMCPKPGDKSLREEMTVLIKSVFISALSNKIASEIEFHLVLSDPQDEQYLRSKIKQFSKGIKQPKMKAYSADKVVSEFYPAGMKMEQKYPCQYIKIFLPKILGGTDAVIYLDTDTIVTGNIQDFWNKFNEMSDDQVVAMGPVATANNPEVIKWFGDLPYVPPKGLNAGVQLMNLTRMREFGWTERHVQLYNDYVFERKVTVKSDQKLSNILLNFHPTRFLELPCQFNFLRRHCKRGFYCLTATTDPSGIQVLHGSGNGFNKGTVFHGVFKSYRDFNFDRNVSSLETYLVDKFMSPIRDHYTIIYNDKSKKGLSARKSCEWAFAKHLFKNILI